MIRWHAIMKDITDCCWGLSPAQTRSLRSGEAIAIRYIISSNWNNSMSEIGDEIFEIAADDDSGTTQNSSGLKESSCLSLESIRASLLLSVNILSEHELGLMP